MCSFLHHVPVFLLTKLFIYLSSQASSDPTSHLDIISLSFFVYEMVFLQKFKSQLTGGLPTYEQKF